MVLTLWNYVDISYIGIRIGRHLFIKWNYYDYGFILPIKDNLFIRVYDVFLNIILIIDD